MTPHADYRIGIASGVCGYYGGGDENPMIRADMIYYKTPGDSAVVRRAAECGPGASSRALRDYGIR